MWVLKQHQIARSKHSYAIIYSHTCSELKVLSDKLEFLVFPFMMPPRQSKRNNEGEMYKLWESRTSWEHTGASWTNSKGQAWIDVTWIEYWTHGFSYLSEKAITVKAASISTLGVKEGWG